MPFPILPILSGVATATGIYNSLTGPGRQADHNMRLAKYQASANERYLQKQLDWNSPLNQRRRFEDAGMNPHLAYSQGNPGNQAAPLTHPEVRPADYQNSGMTAALMPLYNQTRMADAQVDAQNANTTKSLADTELKKIQAAVLRKNPLLDEVGFGAIIDALRSTAEIKAADSNMKRTQSDWFSGQAVDHNAAGVKKMDVELRLLDQRFNLGSLDEKIKAQVLSSKEFQNAILDIQKKFMTDGDISSGQILLFIQSLLLKML